MSSIVLQQNGQHVSFTTDETELLGDLMILQNGRSRRVDQLWLRCR